MGRVFNSETVRWAVGVALTLGIPLSAWVYSATAEIPLLKYEQAVQRKDIDDHEGRIRNLERIEAKLDEALRILRERKQ